MVTGESKSRDESFIDYLESCKKLIFKIAAIYSKDVEERKDLVQDIILQLWRAFPGYNNKFAITTWTYRIALNVSISFLRKAKTRNAELKDYIQYVGLSEDSEPPFDEKIDELYKFISLLKPVDKAIMILHLEACKNKEIAEVMGMSVTNVSTRKERIKNKMKSHIELLKQ